MTAPVIAPPEVIVRKFLCAGDRLFLNAYEAELGRRIGQERMALATAWGLKPHVVQDPKAVLSNHQAGGMAEVAVARWANVWPASKFDDFLFYNLKLAGGDLVAVQWNDKRKACALDHAREAKRIEKQKEAPDLYIVLTGGFNDTGHPLFEFVGWTTHAELLASPVETVKAYGPRWVQDNLHARFELLTCARGQGYRP